MAIKDKVNFVNKFKSVYDVKLICKVIKLPRSVYYYHTQNKPNSYVLANKELDEKILDIYNGSNSRYGAPKITNALNKALANRLISKDCIFHSDRGVQYTSKRYETLLIENGIQHSYSKKGYPYDNAAMESFNATLKKEEVNHKKYVDYNEARLSIFEFIESWYNLKRIHSSIGYLTL